MLVLVVVEGVASFLGFSDVTTAMMLDYHPGMVFQLPLRRGPTQRPSGLLPAIQTVFMPLRRPGHAGPCDHGPRAVSLRREIRLQAHAGH